MAKTKTPTTRRKSKGAVPPDKFVVWLDRDRALVCDWTAELEAGCRVLWIENGWACGEGLLITSKPNNRKAVSVMLEDRPEGCDPIIPNLPRGDVVRVLGVYAAIDPRGELPANGLPGVLKLVRPWVHGKPLLPADVIRARS